MLLNIFLAGNIYENKEKYIEKLCELSQSYHINNNHTTMFFETNRTVLTIILYPVLPKITLDAIIGIVSVQCDDIYAIASSIECFNNIPSVVYGNIPKAQIDEFVVMNGVKCPYYEYNDTLASIQHIVDIKFSKRVQIIPDDIYDSIDSTDSADTANSDNELRNNTAISYESRDDYVVKTTTIVEIFKKIA
jgi:hypothetical protein